MNTNLAKPFFIWLIAILLLPIAAFAQERGTISGRVVTEDGRALAGMNVFLSASGQDRPRSTATDEEGKFEFNNLPERNYFVSASTQKGYVVKPQAMDEPSRGRLRPGATVTITMIRGGVITGRVTNTNGNPLISINVSAIRVRDQNGNRTNIPSGGIPLSTDDRGIYRIYGLLPGTYIVVANSNNFSFTGAPSPYYGEVPTYHPSSTRDTAAEVKVTSGEETTGIDISYRGEPGHAVSGKVLATGQSQTAIRPSVALRSIVTNTTVGTASIQPGQEEIGYAIYGVPDGEYEVTASQGGGDTEEIFYSDPRRVTVKGADVTGINLRLAPTATIAGHFTIEKAPVACDAKLKPVPEELSVFVRRDESGEPNTSRTRIALSTTGRPDQKGDFKINGITPGRYRFQPSLPVDTWFLKSITGPAPAASPAPSPAGKPATAVDLTRGSLPLTSGQHYSGATITITDGGATLRGKVVASTESGKLPPRMQVHLIPAELNAVNDVLRFAERIALREGSFSFANIPPGKYWLLVRALPEANPEDRPPQPAAWDAAERARLRKDGEAAKNEIELKPCQRLAEQTLRYPPPAK